MKKISMIYPGFGGPLSGQLEDAFRAEMGDDLEFTHVGESGILRDIRRYGKIDAGIRDRVLSLRHFAMKTNPDIVVCTCSTIGDIIHIAHEVVPGVQILRIDEPMAVEAVNYKNIAVMATLGTTLVPSCNIVQRMADQLGKQVNIVDKVSEGALDASSSGQMDKYDELMCATAKELAASNDVIVLAQASMAPMRERLEEVTGKPVLASPLLCAKAVKKILGI